MQVLILSLHDNQLTGTVPYMPSLLVLDMSSNRLTDIRFDAGPASLQILYLANNNLTGELLQFGSLPTGYMDLKMVDLSDNNLSGSLPQDMPPNLSILNISNNAFAGTLPSTWSKLQNIAVMTLDNNQLTGTLLPSWSDWGSNTGNSLQLSITNTQLRGRMPRQWVQQFCLNIQKSGDARVLFTPIDVTPDFLVNVTPFTVGPLIQLPAQHASINVTLASKAYTFDYENPDSVCGIEFAGRNTALLWGVFIAVLVATLTGICLWQRRHPRLGPHGGLFGRFSTVLKHDRLRCGRQMVNRMWFLASDVGWFLYSQVTAAITVHQVFSSGQLFYAYLLLVILLLPFAFMFILVARVSILRCQEHIGGKTLICRADCSSSWVIASSRTLVWNRDRACFSWHWCTAPSLVGNW